MSVKDTVFYLGLGTLFTHELDAMPNHEWRVLPLLNQLPDDTGMLVFLVLHIPLFALVIGLVASQQARTRRLSKLIVSGFMIVHAVLHKAFGGHPNYEFADLHSDLIIYAAAALGVVYLALAAREPSEQGGTA